MNSLPLAVTLCVMTLIAGVLINSVVRFSIDQRNSRRRAAAVASSAALVVLLSIFYARAMSTALLRLASWRNEYQPLPSDPAQRGVFQVAGEWLSESYFGWWMENLPPLFATPSAAFRETALPLVVLLLAYIVRGGIYVFLRDQYEKRHAFVSAYWVHITLWFVLLVFLSQVYEYSRVALLGFVLVSLVSMIGSFTTILGDVVAGLRRLAQLAAGVAVLLWKWITITAGVIANALRWMRREFSSFYRVWIRRPIVAAGDWVQYQLDRANEVADRRLAGDEENEIDEDDFDTPLRAA